MKTTATIRLSTLCLLAIMTLIPAARAQSHYHASSNCETPKTWREQMTLAADAAKRTISEIRFHDYKYLGRIRSEAHKRRVVDKMFAPDATVIFCPTEENLHPTQMLVPCRFIVQISQTLNKDKFAIHEDPTLQAKRSVLDMTAVGNEIVEMQWAYRGKIFHTIAIVDDTRGGIVYDNVATHLQLRFAD